MAKPTKVKVNVSTSVSTTEDKVEDDATLLGRIMIDEADRIDSIVTDFMQMSRQRPPVPESLYLPTLFGELERLCRRDGTMAEVSSIIWEVGDDCPRCFADRDQLKQIILNVIHNAAEALATASSEPTG